MSVETGLPQTGAPVIGHPSSPFLLSEEAALYLRFEQKDDHGVRTGAADLVEFNKWLARHNARAERDKSVHAVTKHHRGRRVMFHIDDLDAAIGYQRPRLRRAS
jgi:hypothetical protein